jgi:hypothetical protein
VLLTTLEMVKIVNGVIVSDTAPEAQSTEQANSNALFTVFGYDLTSWHIGAICLLGFLLGGFGLAVLIGGSCGLMYLCKKGNAFNPIAASGPRPGQARVMGVRDLPKAPASC